ncbi:hypothetical protein CFR76_15070 [Komagataeibacter swingsii]|uniref:Uncharacterized protein n=1 Tax=Komagataeibacter swingsii TaxID=215220 RepID=A0A2V4RIF8_9PROT|nr:hypothetical protein CFR76_15070 [Komagataeibacter swingsii]
MRVKNVRKFLVKLFSKSFRERRLFEKRRHPKTFILFYYGSPHARSSSTRSHPPTVPLGAGGCDDDGLSRPRMGPARA